MNAKILLELPGVEAGSKECGECRSLGNPWGMSGTYCIKFSDVGGVDHCVKLKGDYPYILRCPACLAAEEEANTIGAEEGEVMNPKIELWWVITRGKKNRVVEVHATQKNALMDMVPGDNPEPEPVSVVRDGGKLAKKEG
jgi:hypothetical protein